MGAPLPELWRLALVQPRRTLALRPHLGSVIRSGKPRVGSRPGRFFARLLSASDEVAQDDEDHPDLAGARGFAVALDLFRLDPLEVERRLIVRWRPEHELLPGTVAALDALADRRDHRDWDGREETLLTSHEETDETRLIKGWFERIARIDWDDDSRGFTVALVEGTREVDPPQAWRTMKVRVTDLGLRHVSLDGTVGPIVSAPGEPKPWPPLPSQTAIEAIKALVRERSSHRIDCAGWAGAEVAAALREVRRQIDECGLEQLVFGDQVMFRFRVGGRTIGEKRFFEQVRAMAADDIALALPELRALLRSYGSAARKLQASRWRPIASGPSDHSPAAMAEAALTLAMLDDTGFEALRDWVVTVDQEHDYFAAAKVFPAMARRTRFATAEAVRFGLWFFLQQWQTVKYEKNYLGLFKAAPEVLPPAPFASAVLEEARDVDSFSDACSIEGGAARVQKMLGRTFWDRAVSAELDRLLDSLGGAELGGIAPL